MSIDTKVRPKVGKSYPKEVEAARVDSEPPTEKMGAVRDGDKVRIQCP